MKEYYSHGKLLLTGEYVILRGARGLALPTSKGQHLTVTDFPNSELKWTAVNSEGEEWFSARFNGTTLIETSNEETGRRLSQILQAALDQNASAKTALIGQEVVTRLEFPNDWGLGSSSTLIHNISLWLDVDPFDLLEATFGGSGYDIAVAMESSSIIYERHEDEPYHERVEWNPSFKDNLWFVHLGQKKDTHQAIKDFQADEERGYAEVPSISRLTEDILRCDSLMRFEELIQSHNALMSQVLRTPSAQERFSDYAFGVVKYLGAWGGDFMLVTGSEQNLEFFKKKGFELILPYDQMILH